MAKNKQGMSLENRAHLRDEIQTLLSSIGNDDQQSLVVDQSFSQDIKKESPYNFEEISLQFTKKAREITDSLFKNYVDIGIFKDNEYAKHKKEIDTINISNLFFQLKTIKMTIIKVMEEITAGNTHPRLIEVMGQLQDKMADITKMQANYIIFLEDTYQKLNREKPVNGEVQLGSDPGEGQYFITIGTKNVIKSLPSVEKSDKKYNSELVDPTKKSELMRDKNIQFQEESSDEFIDLTEIL